MLIIINFAYRVWDTVLGGGTWHIFRSKHRFAGASGCFFTTHTLSTLCSDINKIAAGIGDKFALSIQYVAAFVAGLVVALTQEYRLALFMLGLTPILAAFGFLFAKIAAAFTSREQKQYASAGAVAEEILSSIRTVYAFGGEKQAAAR